MRRRIRGKSGLRRLGEWWEKEGICVWVWGAVCPGQLGGEGEVYLSSELMALKITGGPE